MCVGRSFTRFPGAWNCRWTLIAMRPDVKWIRILLPSQDYKTQICSGVLGPKIASEAVSQHQIPKKIFLGEHAPRPPVAFAYTLTFALPCTCTRKSDQGNFATAGPVLALHLKNLPRVPQHSYSVASFYEASYSRLRVRPFALIILVTLCIIAR